MSETVGTTASMAEGGSVSSRAGAYLALVAGILCISWSAIFVRWTDIPGSVSAFYRMLIPATILLPTFFLDRKALKLKWETLKVIALGGLFFAGDLALYNTAILRTSAANATLLANNTPIVVGLLTWLVWRRKPSAAFWTGLLLAVGGSMVILWTDLRRHAQLGLGDVMAVVAAIFFAIYLMATERVRTTTSTLGFLRLAMIASTIALLAVNLALGQSLRVPNTKTWLALLAMGIVSQLGGYLALTYALGHLPATVTSMSLLSQGPLTALLAALLLGEPLTAVQVVGGALVLSGVGLAHRDKAPEEEANI
jgi:drug/metabolite transporter (DMT)-like permease